MSEAEIVAKVLLAHGSRADVRLFRNTIGEGWQGTRIYPPGVTRDLIVLKNARYVTFGLAPGSADLIGWRTRLIGGTRFAQFLSFEVKTETGVVAEKQKRWDAAVSAAGGLSGVVRSPECAERILAQAD